LAKSRYNSCNLVVTNIAQQFSMKANGLTLAHYLRDALNRITQ